MIGITHIKITVPQPSPPYFITTYAQYKFRTLPVPTLYSNTTPILNTITSSTDHISPQLLTILPRPRATQFRNPSIYIHSLSPRYSNTALQQTNKIVPNPILILYVQFCVYPSFITEVRSIIHSNTTPLLATLTSSAAHNPSHGLRRLLQATQPRTPPPPTTNHRRRLPPA